MRLPLALVLVFAAGTAAAQADYTDGVSGEEAADLVAAAMSASGLEGPRPAASIRSYPACGSTPDVSPLQGNWTTARISCDGPAPWTRNMRTRADIQTPARIVQEEPQQQLASDQAYAGPDAVVLRRSMERGELVTAADIVMMPRGTLGPADVFASPEEVVGRRLKVTMGPEQVLQTRHLEPAWVIRQGTPVQLEITVGGISVSAPGEALENGRLGDVISLINLGSQQTVKGIVTGENRVQLRPNIY